MSAALIGLWEESQRQHPIDWALTLLAECGLPRDEAAALSIGERDRRLFAYRAALLGDVMLCVAHCPACGAAAEVKLSAGTLASMTGSDGPIELEALGFRVRLRAPDSRAVAAAVSARSVEAARARLLAACVLSIHESDRVLELEQAPPELLDVVEEALQEAHPLTDLRLQHACPACAHVWLSALDVVELLKTEISRAARNLLEDVHVLASRYGWGHDEVLRLSPGCRQFYLERAS